MLALQFLPGYSAHYLQDETHEIKATNLRLLELIDGIDT